MALPTEPNVIIDSDGNLPKNVRVWVGEEQMTSIKSVEIHKIDVTTGLMEATINVNIKQLGRK